MCLFYFYMSSEHKHRPRFFWTIFLQDVCRANNLGTETCLPSEQKASLYTVQYIKDKVSLQGKGQTDLLAALFKRLGSLSFYTAPLYTQHPPGLLRVVSMGLREVRETCANLKFLLLAVPLCDKVSEVLCLLPICRNLWQAKCLACK